MARSAVRSTWSAESRLSALSRPWCGCHHRRQCLSVLVHSLARGPRSWFTVVAADVHSWAPTWAIWAAGGGFRAWAGRAGCLLFEGQRRQKYIPKISKMYPERSEIAPTRLILDACP